MQRVEYLAEQLCTVMVCTKTLSGSATDETYGVNEPEKIVA